MTKLTDGVRCGDKWSNTLLNNLDIQLVGRLQYKEIFTMYSYTTLLITEQS